MELKEIEEQIKDAVYDGDATYRQILERIMIAVQFYGKEQYNQALIDAAQNAEIIYGDSVPPFLNTRSILNLKKH